MKTLFPASFVFAFTLVLIQTYLLVYFALYVMQRLKLLKKPIGGMDHTELIPAAIMLLGTLIISSSDVPGIFQAAQSYSERNQAASETLAWFFARSFTIMLFFCLLYIILNYLNLRYLISGYRKEPVLTISILLSAISCGMAVVFWFSCKEIIDYTTPKFIDFR